MGDFKIGVIADCFRTDIKEGIKKLRPLVPTAFSFMPDGESWMWTI